MTFRKLFDTASPILKISICDLTKYFRARRDESNGVSYVCIGPLYAEVHFSSTRLHRRLLLHRGRYDIRHSGHRSGNGSSYRLSTSCFWTSSQPLAEFLDPVREWLIKARHLSSRPHSLLVFSSSSPSRSRCSTQLNGRRSK